MKGHGFRQARSVLEMTEIQLWALTLVANMFSWVLPIPFLIILHRRFPETLSTIQFPNRHIGEYLLTSLFLLYGATTIIFVGLTGGWSAAILGIYCTTVVGALLWNTIYRISRPVPADPIIILIGFILLSPVIVQLHFWVRQ